MSLDYGTAVRLEGVSMEDAEARVRAALAAEGFGVLTEIDVAGTFKKKLDIDHPPYRILGACNPVLANKAIAADPYVGLVLPCNVVVRAVDGGTEVSFIAPAAMLGVVGDAVADIAADATARLDRVAAALA